MKPLMFMFTVNVYFVYFFICLLVFQMGNLRSPLMTLFINFFVFSC